MKGFPFNPAEAAVERVENFATGAIVMAGQESIVVRLNDHIFRFSAGSEPEAAEFADGIYAAVLALEAAKKPAA